MKPASTPQPPTTAPSLPSAGHLEAMASLSAPTALFWLLRPISSSAIMIGNPTAAMQIR